MERNLPRKKAVCAAVSRIGGVIWNPDDSIPASELGMKL